MSLILKNVNVKMNSMISIKLQNHATNEAIIAVLALATGSSWELKNSGYFQVDYSKPSSEDNFWFFSLRKEDKSKFKVEIDEFCLDLLKIKFKDNAGSVIGMSINLDAANWNIEDGSGGKFDKVITCPSTATYVALGKKLVDFFGGEMVLDEVMMTKYHTIKPKYEKIKKAQSKNEKYYEYQNGIREVKELTSKDMEFAATLINETDDCKYLRDFLRKRENYNQLKEHLPENNILKIKTKNKL